MRSYRPSPVCEILIAASVVTGILSDLIEINKYFHDHNQIFELIPPDTSSLLLAALTTLLT